MTAYAYAALADTKTPNIPQKITEYCKKQKLETGPTIIDQKGHKTHWNKRELNQLINKKLTRGDALVTYEAASLARSTSQVLEVLESLAKRGVSLHLAKYQKTYQPADIVSTKDFLSLVQDIDNDFVTRRTSDALERRREAGLPLGRPKGRKNKSRKLDKFLPDIERYLKLKISKASIAKLVGCHAQTLYNYLEDKSLAQYD